MTQTIEWTDVSVQELINAFCDVLDGVNDHDIESHFGFSEEAANRIANIRSQLRLLWTDEFGLPVVNA